ncbi:hypothetical protein SDRG_04323 [Saprolegnia diclina VS20]|uniref:Thioredoxin domain-containing protein n=1 Tax=Saprolegnia diclina (strain VS20) TaxID=1156394 RepID=T0S7E5_SAPDV|nr:hypothetical protein SDRG_04323 [Saprolegnia diclina VS20]EQC38622.1 hypothetical protein SDRG_04323 [Saprolegnia diclina VS20]|eukprot:XP_008608214.1 hypothetical protein SDRG_04323 [Saprolegnia diclina VS20]
MTTTSDTGFWAHLFSAENTLGDLVDSNGQPVVIADLNPTVLFLISAYWCEPCRALAPTLLAFLETHPNDVSVVYFGRDFNAEMQAFALRDKPMYNRFTWHAENNATFARLGKAYPSLQCIPAVLAIDRDTGKVYSEKAAVGLRLMPDQLLSMWAAGDDITQEQVYAYWGSLRYPDVPCIDFLSQLPLDTIVDATGAGSSFDALNRFVVLYVDAKWAQKPEDDRVPQLTPMLDAFAKANPNDVSVLFYSLDATAEAASETTNGTSFFAFRHSSDLVQIADGLNKILTKDDEYNRLSAPRVLVYDKETHTVVAKQHSGIMIKPHDVVAAWKVGDCGITDQEMGNWHRARYEADQKKKQAAKEAAEP